MKALVFNDPHEKLRLVKFVCDLHSMKLYFLGFAFISLCQQKSLTYDVLITAKTI